MRTIGYPELLFFSGMMMCGSGGILCWMVMYGLDWMYFFDVYGVVMVYLMGCKLIISVIFMVYN